MNSTWILPPLLSIDIDFPSQAEWLCLPAKASQDTSDDVTHPCLANAVCQAAALKADAMHAHADLALMAVGRQEGLAKTNACDTAVHNTAQCREAYPFLASHVANEGHKREQTSTQAALFWKPTQQSQQTPAAHIAVVINKCW